ncbi:MAG: hypothetical protein JRM73_03985 [Nitrososphaerota archaeon]|nr:hypothetical protein [Nitrososphaerota archaeon]
MSSKRYVLLESASDVSESAKEFEEFFSQRFGRAKVIAVQGNPRALIVKTTGDVALLLREMRDGVVFKGARLVPVLTSGAVGNLKKRAAEASVQWRSS